MPITITLELNGYQVSITNTYSHAELMLNLEDDAIAQAIADRDPDFLEALERLFDDHQEIKSVLYAEDGIGSWLQSPHARARQLALQQLIDSQYASEDLKQRAREQLDRSQVV